MYSQKKECFFLRHVELKLEVHCDDDSWSHLGSTRCRHGLQRHLLVLPSRSVPAPEWVLRFAAPSQQCCCTICSNSSFFVCFGVDSSRIKICCVQFSKSSTSPIKISPFKILPRDFLVIASCQIDEFSPDHSAQTDGIQPPFRKYYCPFEWFSKSSFMWRFPIFQEVGDISKRTTAFHRIWPPPFILSWL